MKKLKFLSLVSIFLISTFSFSCATTAKQEENSSAPSEAAEASENTISSEKKDNLSDLEEKIAEEIIPELPEVTEVPAVSVEEPSYEPVDQEPSVEFLLKAAEDKEAELEQAKLQAEAEKKRLEEEIARLSSQLESEKQKNSPQENNSENQITEKPEVDEASQIAAISDSTDDSTEKEQVSQQSEESSFELTEEEEEEDFTVKLSEIKPSRTVQMKNNQFIDITYPGKGWIYQGNIDSDGNIDIKNKNFIFGGRKLGGTDQSFTLRSRNPGKYLLHFYKNDTLTGNYIDDYLEVNVESRSASSDAHISAPTYAEIVPPKAKITAETIKAEKELKAQIEAEKTESETNVPGPVQKVAARKQNSSASSSIVTGDITENSAKTVIQTTESAPDQNNPTVKTDTSRNSAQNKPAEKEEIKSAEDMDSLSSDELLNKAQNLYQSKSYAEALKSINAFFDKAASRIDEGLYLQGQILEEKSPVQNIKDAIESYDLVVKNYPASKVWDKANKRSIFLKRFYINIR